jgi:HD-like signal output (HDOD) protein
LDNEPVNPEASSDDDLQPDIAPDTEAEILDEIDKSIEELDLGFDPEVLDVLDDEKAMPKMFDALKDKLGETTSARLFGIANSVHYGRLSSGRLTRVREVVTHLGTDPTRAMVMFIAMRALASSHEMDLIFARSFAISKLSEIFSSQMGVGRQLKNTISLGALFMEIGKVMIMLYSKASGKELDNEFIEKHYRCMNAKVLEVFGLPGSMIEIVSHNTFRFEKKDSLAPTAILDMAQAVVERSFDKYGKWRIESSMPDMEGLLYKSTIGSNIQSQFQCMEMSSYLEVITSELTEREECMLAAAEK